MKMKAVVLSKVYNPDTEELGEVSCIQTERPEIAADDDVLIKIAYASICGSDPHLLEGAFGLSECSPVGHELSGTIEALGPKATLKGLKVGDKVTGNFYRTCGKCGMCQGGKPQFCEHGAGWGAAHGQYIVWKEEQVYKLPKGVSLLEAALAEPFNIAVHAVELADIQVGAHVAVSGGGGIGLMVTQVLKKLGAGRVTVLEPVEQKRNRAMIMGADYVLNPLDADVMDQVMAVSGGKGFDAVIESSGNGTAARNTLDYASRGGHVVLMSMYQEGFKMDVDLLRYFYWKELRIQGMYLAQSSFQRSVNLLPQVNLKPVIEKIYSLDECSQAYSDQRSGRYAKLVFDCWK